MKIVKRMKAAILEHLNQPLVNDVVGLPDKLEMGQVLVKVFYSGICGSQIGEIEGRHEAFRSAEDEAKLMSLQQKLGTALRATGRGSVHYRACVRCMRVWWWDETEERKRHHTRSRQKMLEKIAKAKPMIGNEEDDEEPQMADGVDPMMWNIRVYVVEGARKL